MLAVLDETPRATSSNATNAFSLTERRLDSRGEIMRLNGPRDYSIALRNKLGGKTTEDFGDLSHLYIKNAEEARKKIDALASLKEGVTIDTMQAKRQESEKASQLDNRLKSKNSPGTRGVITLEKPDKVYENLNTRNPKYKSRRETDVVSVKWAEQRSSEAYEKFVRTQKNLGIMCGGHALVTEAIAEHIKIRSDVNRKILFTQVSHENRADVRFHDVPKKKG